MILAIWNWIVRAVLDVWTFLVGEWPGTRPPQHVATPWVEYVDTGRGVDMRIHHGLPAERASRVLADMAGSRRRCGYCRHERPHLGRCPTCGAPE